MATTFTIEQIKAAHSKVKSGADFPAYAQELKQMGVHSYETFVHDGHTIYHGADGYEAVAPTKYEPLTIANASKIQIFTAELKAHQQGATDFLAFCKICAETGVEKWQVNLDRMTCTYYDKVGSLVLVENIPG